MSYAFIHDHVADFPIQVMCEVLGVSRSGYYGWASRAESARSVEDRVVAAEIRTTHEASRGRYGSPRVHAALRAHGRRVGRKRVARLILAWGCRPGAGAGSAAPPTARTPSRWRRTCSCDFTASAPNRVWLADLNYIWTAENWLYLTVVLDLFSRHVVGWAMADHLRRASIRRARHGHRA